MQEPKKLPLLGKAKFKDFEAFATWCFTDEGNEYFSVPNLWTNCLCKLQKEIPGISSIFDKTTIHDKHSPWGSNRERYYIDVLRKYIEYINVFSGEDSELSFDLWYEHPKFDIISFTNESFLIPKGFLDKTLLKDYSDIPVSVLRESVRGLNGKEEGTSLVPADSALANASLSSSKNLLKEKEEELKGLAKNEEDIKNARVEGLAELQQQIDEMTKELEQKKESLLAELNKKKAEMDLVKEKLERELFMLESEIYSIRCYLGEVVDFVKLISGKPAPIDVPITLFQKMRFLDEELGKGISLYGFDFGDVKLFEKFLKSRSDAVELFCPNEKCVSLVRVSKTAKTYGYINTPYGEMLTEYKVYHGEKIGILIRNGENLYMGWTDEDKINIPEDMFFTPGEKKVSEEDLKNVRSTPVEEIVSRYFIFSILQGVLENTDILALPDGVNASFMRPSEYICYSVADTWLSDNRYGTFADIVNKVNSRINVGDRIMSIESLYDGRQTGGGWYGTRTLEYDRDRNFSRRTHDVHFKDGAIYKINLIEDNGYGNDDYFVSLKKSGYDTVYRNGGFYERQRDAYARFRVYKDEFINLTYMNSAWLKYIITNRNLGMRGKMGNYAESIHYLNTALDFVKKREETEQALIEQYLPNLTADPDWPAKLSEWKLEKKVREITDYQAKRFAKRLKENK